MSAGSRLASGLSALVLDNAVAQKDALVLARQRGVLVGLGLSLVAALLTAGAVALAMIAAVEATAYQSWLFPSGRGLTAGATGVVLVLASLLLPSLSSMTLAPERESGTLRLLLTTALSPEAIVLGKLLAVLHGVAAPLLVALPLVAAGALFSAVSLADVLVCAALVVVNVVVLAAVGVAASATSGRVRVAPGRALAAALFFVWGPIGLPSLVLVVAWAYEGYHPEMIAGAALIGCWAVVVVGGAFLVARDAIAPSASPSRAARRRLLSLSLIGVPVAAAVSLVGLKEPVESDLWSTLYLLGFGALLLVVVVGDVAQRGARAGGAFQAAARSSWLSSLGALLALPIAYLAFEGARSSARSLSDDLSTLLGCAAPIGLWLTLAALVTAGCGRMSSPLRRTASTAAVLLVLWLGPALGNGVLLSDILPLVDPANLMHGATAGDVGPFDTPWGRPLVGSAGACLALWGLALLTVTAGAVRERVLTRR